MSLKLQNLQGDHLSNELLEQERLVKAELNDLLEKEEVFWWQHSRVKWLRERDKNKNIFIKLPNEGVSIKLRGCLMQMVICVKMGIPLEKLPLVFSKIYLNHKGNHFTEVLEAVIHAL